MDQQQSLRDLLLALRQQAIAGAEQMIGSHQLDAHWSIAYACAEAPDPWELYHVPWLHSMPLTSFYGEHPREIQEALGPTVSADLLAHHAVPKVQLEARMTEDECKLFGYPGRAQFFDLPSKKWIQLDVPAIRWFDRRDSLREALLRTNDQKVISQIQSWLTKLDTTPDFAKAMFAQLRGAENEVRRAHGMARVGEGWVSETELLYRTRALLPDVEVIHHGRPPWLSKGQHLDIWIPTLMVAIEYQGEQHFHSVEHFGGAAGLQKRQVLDARKREVCALHGVRLIEIAFDQSINDDELRKLMESKS